MCRWNCCQACNFPPMTTLNMRPYAFAAMTMKFLYLMIAIRCVLIFISVEKWKSIFRAISPTNAINAHLTPPHISTTAIQLRLVCSVDFGIVTNTQRLWIVINITREWRIIRALKHSQGSHGMLRIRPRNGIHISHTNIQQEKGTRTIYINSLMNFRLNSHSRAIVEWSAPNFHSETKIFVCEIFMPQFS